MIDRHTADSCRTAGRPGVLPTRLRSARNTTLPRRSVVTASVRPGAERHAQEGPWQQQQQQARRSVAARVKEGETAEQAMERRLRESAQVDERVVYIFNEQDWEKELAKVRGG